MIGPIKTLALIVTFVLAAVSAARAGDNLTIERLATCQDSWVDWKEQNPAMLNKFVTYCNSGFARKESDPFFIPTSTQTVVGLPVTRVFPESDGMGVGFSVWVNASFDQTKIAVGRKIGQSLKQCETGDNMRFCSIELGQKKTVTLMVEDDPKSTPTLIGCYYFYNK